MAYIGPSTAPVAPRPPHDARESTCATELVNLVAKATALVETYDKKKRQVNPEKMAILQGGLFQARHTLKIVAGWP